MVSYRWEEIPQTHRVELVAIIDGKRHHFVRDLNEYEKAIRDNPYLIMKYDLNDPKDLRIVHRAVKEIIKSHNKDKEFKEQLLELGVRPGTLREWMMMDAMKYDEPRTDILYIDRKKKVKKPKTKRKCRCKK